MQKKKEKNNSMKGIKLIIIIAIVAVVVWFIVFPFIKFRENKNKMQDGAERYIEVNRNRLPEEGEVRTISLSELYQQKYVDTLYTPLTKKLCSVKDSWVKVTNVDGKYKYHVYLKCGVYTSMVDHKGPNITLNGKENITITKGEKFSDPGVKSVNDNEDGKIEVSQVKIKNNVNTSKVGKYKITYTVTDSLQNETVVERKVTVIEKLNETVKKDTDNTGIYKGNVDNNYIMFSGMLFRIVKVNDDDTIRIVTDENIAYLDYNNINKWLNGYFYEHLNDNSKKYIAKEDFCSDTVKSNPNKVTKCSKQDKANVGILSIADYNNSKDKNDSSYLFTGAVTWTKTANSAKKAWIVQAGYHAYTRKDVNVVRPVVNLVKSVEIKSGTGTHDNPYMIGDYSPKRKSTKVNQLTPGEYITYAGYTWRFIEKLNNGSSKIIMDGILNDKLSQILVSYEKERNRIYNPKENGNLGYKINQGLGDYIKTTDFTNFEIDVPIYKNKAVYGGAKQTKNYKVKLAAPKMSELFSGNNEGNGYWFRDSSNNKERVYISSENNSIYNETQYPSSSTGVKLVASLNKNMIISSGKGTKEEPYKVTK